MYQISPQRLNDHADALETDAGSISTATSYTTEHVHLTILDTALLYAKACAAANDTESSINEYLGALDTALTASATELDGTATRSRELDDDLEAQLDASYPGDSTTGQATTSTDVADGAAPAEAVAELTAPATEAPSDLVSEILTTDWLSPSSVLAQVLDWIFDWNYIDEITEKFSGDWNRLYEVSDALKKLGAYVSAQGDNVEYAMAVTATSWTGEAATAANVFFTEMAQHLRDAGTEIANLGPEFETVSVGMADTASLLAGLFSQVLDAALIAAACIAGGTVSIETVIGGVIGYLCGAGEIGYALWLAKDAYDVVQSVLTFFDAIGASVGFLSSFLAGGADLPLPTGYDNAQVN